MSSSEPSAPVAGDGANVDTATAGEISPSTDLTITEAARAVDSSRRLIRGKLHAGEFPNAAKDAQGFWRIPEGDLLGAGLRIAGEEPVADPLVASVSAGSVPAAPSIESVPAAPSVGSAPSAGSESTDEMQLLRIEILDLRHQVERAEALLEAERRLSEERARALEIERATVDALYRQTGLTRPTPRPPDPPRVDWQSRLREARKRDLQQRATRE